MGEDKVARIKVNIYGQEYALKGPMKPERVLALARHVDGVMRSVGESNQRLGANDVAILAALNITEELFACREKLEELEERLSKLSPKEAKRAYHARRQASKGEN